MDPNDIPRLAPDWPLPPYAHVPGRTPHPVSDPQGHSYGAEPDRPPPPDAERWSSSRAYLRGLDLFNHGYYWEAHEAWEALWHACGRSGLTADFLKGLIKLAAAGVKVREGRPDGARSHARRAAELFRRTADRLGERQPRYMGLPLAGLIDFAARVADEPPRAGDAAEVVRVFDVVLRPA
jgi:hypothetical protein